MSLWNRVRYTAWAPAYDRLVHAMGFDRLRQRSIEQLQLEPGESVLIVGAGTGLDLPHLPPGVRVAAVDVTPAMLHRLRRRAAACGLEVDARVMDARSLQFDTGAFDAVILHLILAVMPEPARGLRETARVLRPGGRVAVFDKFLRISERVTLGRRVLNLVARPLFSDMNRRLEPLLAGTGLVVERDEPAALGGMYRLVTLRKDRGAEETAGTPRSRPGMLQ
jgi:ubiquinone/menaquinone biosynthesis C-methylase UbiE